MLDLAKVLEFIDDGFNQRPPPQDSLIEIGASDRLHVFSDLRDELKATRRKELGQPFGDVALVSVKFAKETVDHAAQRLAIIDIPWRQLDVQQFAQVIDY